jgi:hypothetical protein
MGCTSYIANLIPNQCLAGFSVISGRYLFWSHALYDHALVHVYQLGQPLGQIVLTVVVVILGYLSWTITLNFLSPSFSFGAVAGSIIGWVLFHSFVFGYHPNTKHIQPKRGIYNMIIVVIAVAIWIPLLKVILAPIAAKVVVAGVPVPPFDISVLSMLYTLHVVAILAVVHSLFWFKMPFTPLGPPIGPEEIPPGA